MLVTIRLFARLREMAGGAELRRELPEGATARNAWEALVAEFPGFDDYSRAVSCAVNEEYARMTSPLNDGDEVAFLPPVSGG
jgi:molybdopterin converting factor subunit 1